MKKRSRKFISILITLSFLMSMMTFIAAPASAISVNHVSKVITLDDEYDGPTGVTLTIKEDDDFLTDFDNGDIFQVMLPSGVNWNDAAATGTTGANASIISDQIMELTIAGAGAGQDTIEIPLDIEIDGADGDITVEIDAIDSGVSSGKYVFARVSGDATTAKAISVETFGDPGQAGDLRIEEASVGSLGDGKQNIKLELPSHFDWDKNGQDKKGNTVALKDYVSFSGGFAGITYAGEGTDPGAGEFKLSFDDENLFIWFDPKNVSATRGMITVKTFINPDKDADYGDVEVSISGTEADDADVLIGKYSDFGVDVSIDSVKELFAGKFNNDEDVDTITIEESVPGTFIEGRDFTIEFPSWVKILDCDADTSGGIGVDLGDIDGDDNELDVTITKATSGDEGKIELDLQISIEGNKTGDVEATITGKRCGLGDDVKVVVAKAIAPVTATSDGTKDVKIGVQGQEINDIYITETKKEAIVDDPEGSIKGYVFLTLPDGAKFTAKPKVEVVEGNLELDEDNILLVTVDGNVDSRVQIPVDDTSSKVSKIKVSGIKVTLDRTVPEGDLIVKVGGGAIIENQKGAKGFDGKGSADTVDAGEFDTGTVAKIKAGNVITPAPGEVTGVSTFKIGEAKFVLNGIEKTMDVAPYISGDRTFMPVRYVANACGVDDANIMWNAADSTVILIKGDRVVKLAIGSNTMLINGIAMSIDAAPEIKDPGRTMLPLRAIAQALGCVVTWDAATQTVTVTL
jgi:hypothetical protein